TAPSITLGNGDQVLSFATAPYTGGDITFTATDNTGTTTAATTTSQATIRLDGATLRGRDIRLSTMAAGSGQFNDNSQVSSTLIRALNFTANAGAAIVNADSEIQLGTGTVLDGASLTLDATATASATVQANNNDLTVAYGEVNPTARVAVADGATIRATGDLRISASATGTTSVHAQQNRAGQQQGDNLGLTLAVSQADIQSLAQIGNGSVIVGGNLQVNATMAKHLNTNAAAGSYDNGAVGAGVALVQSTSNVHAQGRGIVYVAGDILFPPRRRHPRQRHVYGEQSGPDAAGPAERRPGQSRARLLRHQAHDAERPEHPPVLHRPAGGLCLRGRHQPNHGPHR